MNGISASNCQILFKHHRGSGERALQSHTNVAARLLNKAALSPPAAGQPWTPGETTSSENEQSQDPKVTDCGRAPRTHLGLCRSKRSFNCFTTEMRGLSVAAAQPRLGRLMCLLLRETFLHVAKDGRIKSGSGVWDGTFTRGLTVTARLRASGDGSF